MSDYSLRIGLAPVRRNLPGKRTGIFNQDYAKASKDVVIAHLRKHFEDAETTFFDLEYLNEEGLLYDEKVVPAVADHFRAEDAVPVGPFAVKVLEARTGAVVATFVDAAAERTARARDGVCPA